MLKDGRVNDQRHRHTHESPIKMSVMIDAIPGLFRSPSTIHQKQNPKKPSRHRDDHKYTQHGLGLEHNIGKQHRTDGSRSTQTTIKWIVFFLDERRDITQRKAQNIDQCKVNMPPCADSRQHDF